MPLAKLLLVEKDKVRFRSLLNGRIFGLLRVRKFFELVELDDHPRKPFVKRFLYQGSDEEEVKRVIVNEMVKEVRDVW